MTTEIISTDDSETLIRCVIKVQRDKSILIENLDGDDVWLPLSQVEVIDTDEVVVPNWIAEEKGLL